MIRDKQIPVIYIKPHCSQNSLRARKVGIIKIIHQSLPRHTIKRCCSRHTLEGGKGRWEGTYEHGLSRTNAAKRKNLCEPRAGE